MAGATISLKLDPSEYQVLLDALRTQMDALRQLAIAKNDYRHGKISKVPLAMDGVVVIHSCDVRMQTRRTEELLNTIGARG